MSKDNGETAHNANGNGSLRERQRSDRENAVLSAASSLIGRGDFGAVTMDDLAAQVGVSKPTLYAHFASKEEIYLRVVLRMIADACVFVDDLSPDLPAVARIEATVRYMLTGKIVRGAAHLGTGRDAIGAAIRARTEYRAEYARLVGRMTTLFDDAKREGDMKPELSTRIAVQCVASFLRDAEYGDLVERGETDANAVVETLTTILINGFRVTGRGNKTIEEKQHGNR